MHVSKSLHCYLYIDLTLMLIFQPCLFQIMADFEGSIMERLKKSEDPHNPELRIPRFSLTHPVTPDFP